VVVLSGNPTFDNIVYDSSVSVNNAPAGTDASVTLLEDNSATLTAANFGFTDTNGNSLSAVKITTLPTAGSLTLGGVAVTAGQEVTKAQLDAGQLVFTPAANANGTGYANFTFQVRDDGGTANGGVDLDQSPNTITFNVTAVNDAPTTVDDAGTYLENAPIAKDVVANDSDVDNANSELKVGSANVRDNGNLSNGLSLAADGRTLVFDQNAYVHTVNGTQVTGFDYLKAGETATVLIDYNIVDPAGANSSSTNPPYSTFTVTITGVNDAPAGTDSAVTLLEDGSVALSAANFGFTDVDGNALQSVTITAVPTAGLLTLNGTAVTAGQVIAAADLGGLVFTPAPNANGAGYANLQFQVTDNGGTANGGADTDASPNTLTFNVTPVEDAGVARADIFTTGVTTVFTGNVFANDTDVDSALMVGAVNGNTALVGQTVTVGSGATVRINANGTITYTPIASNTNYSDNFTYSLSDGATASVTVVVQAGNPNNPFIYGTPGNDNLVGTDAGDVLVGRAGADRLDGGNGIDTASYATDEGGVFVNLSLGQGFGNAAQGDTYVSIENVVGTAFNDFIIGDPGVNRLEGGAGNDTIIGGLGADVLIGGDGIDTLSFEDNSGTVFVDLLAGKGYNNAAQGDTFSGFENVIGGLFDDTIIGDNGANRIDGAMGADTLVGNGGADTFVFSYAPGATSPFGSPNVDTIFDFVSGEDKLEFNAAAFGGGLTPGMLDASAFVLGTQAQDANDRFIYDQASGKLYFDVDGAGGQEQVLVALLPNHNTIVASDLVMG
jgi:Ca2+-binding RTX toxin-like protein